EQLHGVVERAQHQRRAAERIFRIGERHHEVHDHDAGFLAEADRGVAVTAPLVVVGHRVPLSVSRKRSPDGAKRNPGFLHVDVTAPDFATLHPGYLPTPARPAASCSAPPTARTRWAETHREER